jgi:hypothetical protein
MWYVTMHMVCRCMCYHYCRLHLNDMMLLFGASCACTSCINFHKAVSMHSSSQLCRFERWNVTDEMINKAKTDYIAVSWPEAAGKREPLRKTGLAASICAFLDAHAPGVQVSPVVALQNMIRWGNFKPDALFCYHVGNTLSGTKTIMCVTV